MAFTDKFIHRSGWKTTSSLKMLPISFCYACWIAIPSNGDCLLGADKCAVKIEIGVSNFNLHSTANP